MSEAPDQPVAEAPQAADTGVAAEAPATTTDDIDTDAFDRMPAPDEDADDGSATGGEPGEKPSEDKPAVAADDTIELDVAGQKVKIPKAIEPLLLMQADYTKKTQAHAEAVRNWEAERTQQAESLKAFRAEHLSIDQREASLAKIDTDLAEYRKLSQADWEAVKAENPAAYQGHLDNYENLRRTRSMADDALTAAKADLKTKETALTERQKADAETALANSWREANAVLTTKIPGWSAEKAQEIGAFVMKDFGVTADQLRQSTDPVAWRMANRLMEAEAKVAKLEKAAKQTTVAAQTAKAAEVTPAVKPQGGNAQPRGVSDGLDTDEWMRRRNAQVARRQAAR